MPQSRPSVLLADDHPMILGGLCRLLEPDLEVVGMATDGAALLEAAKRLRPDLVITDLAMPGLGGIEATRLLQVSLPAIRVLVLSICAKPSCVRAAFEAGAWGYLTKSTAPEEIEGAVREVLAGHFYVSPAVARAAVGPLDSGVGRLPGEAEPLTPREDQIVRLVAVGCGNKDIAQRLGLGVATIRTHLNSVYGKLQVKSRVELALYAAKTGDLAA